MLAAFCAKSTIHAVIQRLSGQDGWKDSVAIMQESFPGKEGTYIYI